MILLHWGTLLTLGGHAQTISKPEDVGHTELCCSYLSVSPKGFAMSRFLGPVLKVADPLGQDQKWNLHF